MSDLIERLRQQSIVFDQRGRDIANEAADEIERLTKENEELRNAIDQEMVTTHLGVFNRGDDPVKAIKELMLWSQGVGEYFAKEELAALKAQTEPVADYIIYWHGETPQLVGATEANIQHAQELGGRYELVYPHPPKQESTEPVAWRTFDGEGGYDLRNYQDNENYKEWYATYNPKYPHWCEPLYLAQPTATALVADFKRRAVEVCMNKAESVTQLNYAGGCEWCSEAIKSLPLIGEK